MSWASSCLRPRATVPGSMPSSPAIRASPPQPHLRDSRPAYSRRWRSSSKLANSTIAARSWSGMRSASGTGPTSPGAASRARRALSCCVHGDGAMAGSVARSFPDYYRLQSKHVRRRREGPARPAAQGWWGSARCRRRHVGLEEPSRDNEPARRTARGSQSASPRACGRAAVHPTHQCANGSASQMSSRSITPAPATFTFAIAAPTGAPWCHVACTVTSTRGAIPAATGGM